MEPLEGSQNDDRRQESLIPAGFLCPGCSYELGGAPSRRCPECGRDCTAAELAQFDGGLPDRRPFLGRWVCFAAPGWTVISLLAVAAAVRWCAVVASPLYVITWFCVAALLSYPGPYGRLPHGDEGLERRTYNAVWLLLAPILHAPWAFVVAQKFLTLQFPAMPMPALVAFAIGNMLLWLVAPMAFVIAWWAIDSRMMLRPLGTIGGLRIGLLWFLSAITAMALGKLL